MRELRSKKRRIIKKRFFTSAAFAKELLKPSALANFLLNEPKMKIPSVLVKIPFRMSE